MLRSLRTFSKHGSPRSPIFLTLSLVLCSASAWPQTQLATVFGTVTDPTGAVIAEAQITISSINTGLKRAALTDTNGQYHLPGLPPGMYGVRAEKEKFQTQVLEGIVLGSGTAIAINLSLRVGTVPQDVTVKADAAIDTTTSTVSEAIAERSLTDLPLNGRDLFKAAVLEPGVVPTPSSAPSLLSSGKASQVSVNGMRPSWTNVLIDGMDANDPVFGFSPAGASGLFLGLNGLTEVRSLTQTVDTEYGGSAGGVIEAVTKSGNNQFHGSLWVFHRDASLDARNYFDLSTRPIPAFVRNQFGGGIGGPIVHDRTFLSANYEGFREVRASTAIATVPNALAHQGLLPSINNPGACSDSAPSRCVAVTIDPRVQEFIALLPPSNSADNGNGTGDLITANKGNTSEHNGVVRLDNNFSNSHTLFGRYIIDDSSSLYRNTTGSLRPWIPSPSSSAQSILYCSGPKQSRTGTVE